MLPTAWPVFDSLPLVTPSIPLGKLSSWLYNSECNRNRSL
ncbi:unnamed protein product [Acanthoscelides obtectus]|uniref:Uncharacterized protein n=1 Tax=Acanthoscelides obtectus TaxID=200917 RepID=A0A9P0L6P6_ACAOB|nr:unnamed protein product [Acanthoscelides obtectus]CAK1629775.1 hypothetical protein AOBTE_LOCUS5946 [Acanthoscelides obtectus]